MNSCNISYYFKVSRIIKLYKVRLNLIKIENFYRIQLNEPLPDICKASKQLLNIAAGNVAGSAVT